MGKIKNLFSHGPLRVIKWAVFILLAGYVILVIVRVVQLSNTDKTEAQVAKIHAAKLQLSDVMGDNLPPDPGVDADKTIAGIDANNNGIRDDVELAVFKEYPNSAKTRAVLLQYALALQVEVIQPFVNTVIATEVVREQSRGFQCIGSVIPNPESQDSLERLDALIKFIKDEQFDSKDRINSRSEFLKEVRSYSDLETICDIDLETLPK